MILVLPASPPGVRMGRGPLPRLLAGRLAVSSPHSPTLGPGPHSPLRRRLLSRQNGQTRDSTVLLSPLLSCCRDSILMSKETPGPAFVGIHRWDQDPIQIQEVRAVGVIRIRGASCWARWLFLSTVSSLCGYLAEWLQVLAREPGRAFLV